MTMVPQGGGTISRAGGGGSGNLYDILELILDRGLVIDVFVRVSLVGIEILKIDARIVVASVDTYLRFAEACNRLDLEEGRKAPSQLTDLVGEVTEGGAHGKAKGALSGAADVLTDALKGGRDDDEAEQPEKRRKEPEERRERPRRRPAARRREE
ncbi:gas vesicle structural protein GvpA [Streptomyces atratus]|uniref:gas vesicle structural protein GvpA n=1 Tax=Streptomyces atratus TaxID=1893 RepID=UPI00166FB25B|nr:gas vesicle structural protein GvpA [Streptomyces atratus]WPW26574.1 gas vesicle structural protein GvpA [Streptomyces atratus]GGT64666.1 putative gas vesicle structural protein 1 [Streptomyces atratus]